MLRCALGIIVNISYSNHKLFLNTQHSWGIVVTKYALNFQKIKIDVLKSSLLLGIFRYKE